LTPWQTHVARLWNLSRSERHASRRVGRCRRSTVRPGRRRPPVRPDGSPI